MHRAVSTTLFTHGTPLPMRQRSPIFHYRASTDKDSVYLASTKILKTRTTEPHAVPHKIWSRPRPMSRPLRPFSATVTCATYNPKFSRKRCFPLVHTRFLPPRFRLIFRPIEESVKLSPDHDQRNDLPISRGRGHQEKQILLWTLQEG
jgi:hypothetical protein